MVLEESKIMPCQHVSHKGVKHNWLSKITREVEVNYDIAETIFLPGS